MGVVIVHCAIINNLLVLIPNASDTGKIRSNKPSLCSNVLTPGPYPSDAFKIEQQHKAPSFDEQPIAYPKPLSIS